MEKWKKTLWNVCFYTVIVVLIVVFVFLMFLAFLKINCYAAEGKAPEKLCVLIDPGHGGEDGGAVGVDGVIEKGLNLAIANYLREYYEVSGFEVVMTRDDDFSLGDTSLSTPSERTVSDIRARLEYYNRSDVDFVVSIHQNKYTESKYSGAQIFYSPNDEGSERFAECIRKSVVGFLQPENTRELKKAGSNIYLLNNCAKPSVLVECGFLSNYDEAAKLNDEEYQKQMAFAIYCGTLEYVKAM